jgi:predicted metal-dependent peptidase
MTKPTIETAPLRDNHLSAAEKIQQALRWVGKKEPIVVPTVLTRWEVRSDRTRPTMSTNGKVLSYNPDFVDRLSFSATKAIVLHEVGHVLNQHQHRRGQRDLVGFNIAADLALNCQLQRGYIAAFNGNFQSLYNELIDPGQFASGCFAGFGEFSDFPANLTAEEYYDLANSKAQQQQQQSGSNEDSNEDNEDSDSNEDNEDSDSNEDSEDSEDSKDSTPSDPAPSEDSDPAPSEDSGPSQSIFAKAFGDPTETFGGGIEDSPAPEDEKEDAQSILLEVLLNPEGCDKYSPLGLGMVLQEARQALIGDPEVAAAVNWRVVLDEFLTNAHAGQPTFARVNRRLHSLGSDLGVIFPCNHSRNKTNGAVIVDTSGSMGTDDCEQALTHIGTILETFPSSTVNMIQCDTHVHCSDEYTGSDFPPKNWQGWMGRGGTDLNPAFRFVRDSGEAFDWVVVVTDGEFSRHNLVDPDIPVLWVVTRSGYFSEKPFPFGVTVYTKA